MSAPTKGSAKTAAEKPQSEETVYSGENLLAKQLFPPLELNIRKYVDISGKLAQGSTSEESIKEWMKTSEAPEAIKVRDQISALTKKLKTLAETELKKNEIPESEQEKLKTEQNALSEQITNARKAIATIINLPGSDIDSDGVTAALDKLGDPTKKTRKTGVSKGQGLARASVKITLNGGVYNNQKFETFSALALELKHISVEALQKKFAEAAEVDPSDIASVKKPVDFSFTMDKSDTVYHIHTEPKERKKPGPRPGGNSVN